MNRADKTHSVLGALSMLLVGCHGECLTLAGSPGVTVQIVDAATGRSLADVAVVTVERQTAPRETRTGPFQSPPGTNPIEITQHREGRYRITLQVPGYQTWSHSVYVPDVTDACTHNEPAGVDLVAQLQHL